MGTVLPTKWVIFLSIHSWDLYCTSLSGDLLWFSNRSYPSPSLWLDSKRWSSRLMNSSLPHSALSFCPLLAHKHCSTPNWLLVQLLHPSLWALLYEDCRRLISGHTEWCINEYRAVMISVFYIRFNTWGHIALINDICLLSHVCVCIYTVYIVSLKMICCVHWKHHVLLILLLQSHSSAPCRAFSL